MKYFIIAGEASGDLHAAHLIEAIKKEDKEACFVGLGGDKMAEKGCRLIVHYREMAYMGIVAVVKNIGKVRENMRKAKEGIKEEKPDALILVDYPTFNLKIGEYCKKNLPNTLIYYYIAPKVWAWKKWRIHKIAKVCDNVMGILPFEPKYWAEKGYKCDYIGNPTAQEIAKWKEEKKEGKGGNAWLEWRISNENSALASEENVRTIAILPGSRKGEIVKCLPTMLEAAKEAIEGKYRIAIAMAPGIEEKVYHEIIAKSTENKEEIALTKDTYSLVEKAYAAIVNSGTATLETALIGCPQVAVYHIACSKYLMWLKPVIFSIPYFTLVNLIAEKELIKELVGGYFTKENIVKELKRLLYNEEYRQEMVQGYNLVAKALGNNDTAQEAAKKIIEHISCKR